VLLLLDTGHPRGIADLINATIARGMTVTHWRHGAFWVDVNTPEALERAESELKGYKKAVDAALSCMDAPENARALG